MLTQSQSRGRRSLLLATALSTGVFAFSVPNLAMAADAPSQTAQTPAIEEIVVTGSLIVRNGYQAPTPVTVVNVEDIERSAPINFADYAQKIPTLAASFSSHQSAESTGDGNAGANILNLRALNANRTLVLLDGVRVSSTSASGYYGNGGAVDINVFPDALISRVDVVTGGATATYGSGALAGAVNFILDTHFVGLKASVTGGITTYGDDPMYGVNVSGGTNFGNDRGHAMFSVSDSWNAGVPDGHKRPWLNAYTCRISNPAYTPTNGQPFYLIEPGCFSAGYAAGALITSGPLKGITFGPGGVPQPFHYGSLSDGVQMVGGSPANTGPLQGNWGPESSLDEMVARQSLFARVSYDITDDVNVYAQYIWAHALARGNVRYNVITGTVLSGNPFIPSSLQTQMTSLGVTSFNFGQYTTNMPPIMTHNSRNFGDFLGGVKGSFEAMGSNWTYNAFVTYSQTRNSLHTYNGFVKANYAAAVDAVQGPGGTVICRVNVTNPANACVAYNPFGLQASPAAINYLIGTPDQQFDRQNLSLFEGKATLAGEPFSTWAGPVSVAVGAEYQRNKAQGVTDPIDAVGGFTVTNYSPVIGVFHATEGYGEVVVPLAKDAVWARSFDLNAGARLTDFSTSGNVWTWKIGATYKPIDDILIRGTRSRDTRQPNMGELFATALFNGPAIQGNNPWLAGRLVTFPSFTGGNPALAPEKADTTGIGGVYSPAWFPGFNASVDYYHIRINGAIATLGTQQTLNNCYAGQTVYCAGIVRDAGNNILQYTGFPFNTAGQTQTGLDIEASYTLQLADMVNSWEGSITARGLITHLIDQTSIAPDGTVTPGTNPPTRYNISVSYSSDSWTVGWTGRGVGNALIGGLFTACTSGCPTLVSPRFSINTNTVPGRFYMDADITYHMKTETMGQYDIFATIDNLVNRQPPGEVMVAGFANVPNPLGRQFRAGVRFKM